MLLLMSMDDINVGQDTMINAQPEKDHGIYKRKKYDEEDGDIE